MLFILSLIICHKVKNNKKRLGIQPKKESPKLTALDHFATFNDKK